MRILAVIGGGFIGVEVAENLRLAGRGVTLVEFAPQILTPFDEDMVQILHKELLDHGVNLIVRGWFSRNYDRLYYIKFRKNNGC
ncbi:hypothetical protein LSPH24S_07375 [Lysinibacillus sphaericus]